MLKKLRIKFICINMIIVTAMLCIIFGLVFHFTRTSLETESLQVMQELAARPTSNDIRLPYFILQIGSRGDIISISKYFDLSDGDFLEELINKVFSINTQTGVIDEYNLRFYRSASPYSQLIVFMDISSEVMTLNNLTKTCILIGTVSFLVFMLISFVLARWAVKPVEKAWIQQRQFVSDASHELKTPLTVIMTNAELLQSPDYDEAARSQFSDSILTMSHQMRGLVEGLLELARVDNGTAKMTFSSLDFSKLIYDALLPFEPVFFEKGLTLTSQIEPEITLTGSESHLKQVIDILLDNAQKYSAPGSEAVVTLKKKNRTHCLLTVATAGDEISPEDLKNIFRRFYRIDKARSMNSSYGLGLSIAESIVNEHHGKIWAESASGANTFFVELPVG